MLPMGWNQIRQSRVPDVQPHSMPYGQHQQMMQNQQHYDMYHQPSMMPPHQMYPPHVMGTYGMHGQQTMTGNPQKPPEPEGPPPPSPPAPLPTGEVIPPPPPDDGTWWESEMKNLINKQQKNELERMVGEKWFQTMTTSQQIECWQHKLQLLNKQKKDGGNSQISKPPSIIPAPSVSSPSSFKPQQPSKQSGTVEEELMKAREEEANIKQQVLTFERQYGEWKKQFDDWKDKHKSHPNKQQFAQYEAQWMTWQKQMSSQKSEYENSLQKVQGKIKELEHQKSETQALGDLSGRPGFHGPNEQTFPNQQPNRFPGSQNLQQQSRNQSSRFPPAQNLQQQSQGPRFGPSFNTGQRPRFNSLLNQDERFTRPPFGDSQVSEFNQRPQFGGNLLSEFNQRPQFGDNQVSEFNQRPPQFDNNEGSRFNQRPRFDNNQGPRFNQRPRFENNQGRGFGQRPQFANDQPPGFNQRSGFDESQSSGFNQRPRFSAPGSVDGNSFRHRAPGSQNGNRGPRFSDNPALRFFESQEQNAGPRQRFAGPRVGGPRFGDDRQHRGPRPRGPLAPKPRNIIPPLLGEEEEEYEDNWQGEEHMEEDDFGQDFFSGNQGLRGPRPGFGPRGGMRGRFPGPRQRPPQPGSMLEGPQFRGPRPRFQNAATKGRFPGPREWPLQLQDNFAEDDIPDDDNFFVEKEEKVAEKEEKVAEKEEKRVDDETPSKQDPPAAEKDSRTENDWNVSRDMVPMEFGNKRKKRRKNKLESFTFHDALKDKPEQDVDTDEKGLEQSTKMEEKKEEVKPEDDYSHYDTDDYLPEKQRQPPQVPRGRGVPLRGWGRGGRPPLHGRGRGFPDRAWERELDFEDDILLDEINKPPHLLLREEGQFNIENMRRTPSHRGILRGARRGLLRDAHRDLLEAAAHHDLLDDLLPVRDLPRRDPLEADIARRDLMEGDIPRRDLLGVDLARRDLLEGDFPRRGRLLEANLVRRGLLESDITRRDRFEAGLARRDLLESDLPRRDLLKADLSRRDLLDSAFPKKDLLESELGAMETPTGSSSATATPISSSGPIDTEAIMQKAKQLSNLDIKNLLSAVKSIKKTDTSKSDGTPPGPSVTGSDEGKMQDFADVGERDEETALLARESHFEQLARGFDEPSLHRSEGSLFGRDRIPEDDLASHLSRERLTDADLVAAGLDPMSLGLRDEDLLLQDYLLNPSLRDRVRNPVARDPLLNPLLQESFFERDLLMREIQEMRKREEVRQREEALREEELREALTKPILQAQKIVETIDYSHGLKDKAKDQGKPGERGSSPSRGSPSRGRGHYPEFDADRRRFPPMSMDERMRMRERGLDDRMRGLPPHPMEERMMRERGMWHPPRSNSPYDPNSSVVVADEVGEALQKHWQLLDRERQSMERKRNSMERRRNSLERTRSSREREEERRDRERSLERLRRMERELKDRERLLNEREKRLKSPKRARDLRDRNSWKPEGGVRSRTPPRRRFEEERARDRERRFHSPSPRRGRARSPSYDRRGRSPRDRSPRRSPKDRGRDARDRRRFTSPSGDSKTRSPRPPLPKEIKPVCVRVEDLLNDPARQQRPKRIVIILRGLPGSGKSHIAKLIRDKESAKGVTPRLLGLDDYFMVENEKFEKDADTGKIVKRKVHEYEYEAAMEPRYRESLLKAFKKTLEDGFFNFVIVDAVNDKVAHFSEFWTAAKKCVFEVYVAELTADVHVCVKRNTHKRELSEIQAISNNWEPTPAHMIRLDVRQMLQDSEIQEVEMGDISDDENKSDSKNEKLTPEQMAGIPQSKWELMEANERLRLDKLDGIKKKKLTSSQQDMAEFLSVTDDYVQRSSAPGKKRVRWADIEERSTQQRLREVGFVVGQTDWNRLVDGSIHADAALNRTKFI